MAEILLFHHAHGLTSGVRGFADSLRAAGHTVHTPDLYDGQVFDTLDDGLAHARSVGFGTLLDRGVAAAEGLSPDLVYAGFSLGVMPAQRLAQERTGAKGALLFNACLPPSEFGDGTWPAGLRGQVHGMEADPFFADDGDLDAARALAEANPEVELFVYPGDQHLFADAGLPSYDEKATALLSERVVRFLADVG